MSHNHSSRQYQNPKERACSQAISKSRFVVQQLHYVTLLNYASIIFDVKAYLIARSINLSVIGSIERASTLPSLSSRGSLLT